MAVQNKVFLFEISIKTKIMDENLILFILYLYLFSLYQYTKIVKLIEYVSI